MTTRPTAGRASTSALPSTLDDEAVPASAAPDAPRVALAGPRPRMARIRDALTKNSSRRVSTCLASTMTELIEVLDHERVECLLLDAELSGAVGLEGLTVVMERHPDLAVIMLSRDDGPTAEEALRLGALDHLGTRDLDGRTVHRAVGYVIEQSRARTAERRLSLLLGRAAEVVLVIDPERVITYASASVEAVLGYTVDEVVGRPGAFFTHPDDLQEFRGFVLDAALNPGHPLRSMGIRARHADGSWRWGEVTITNMLDDPAVNGLVLNVRDVTERQLAQRDVQIVQARRDAILARSSDLVLFFDPDGTITWASPACRNLFGSEPDDLVGRNGLDFIHPDDREDAFSDFASIPQLGDHVRSEFRVIDLQGRTRWVEEVATNLVDEPSVGAVVGNLRDVTDRRIAEDAVQFQARLLGAAGQPIVAYDDVGIVLYWNEAACDVFGWTQAEAVGRHVAELLPPLESSRSVIDDALLHVARAEEWSGDVAVRDKGGTVVPVQVSHTPLLDDRGVHLATIGVYTEISQRLRSEELAARLSSVVDSSSDAIFSLDVDGHITTWNPAAARLYGYERSEVHGRHLRVLAPDERQDEVERHLERLRLGDHLRTVGSLCRRADGSEFSASVTMSPMTDASGGVIGASIITRDVSALLALQRQLQQEHRRLSDAQASARLGSFEVDLDSGAMSRSAELWRILGREPGSVDRAGLEHIHPDDRELLRRSYADAIEGGNDVECIYRILRPNGEIRWVEARTVRRDAESRRLTGTVLDITERHEAELAIEHLAFHDALTGLANRTRITRELEAMLADEATPASAVTVALLDLDQFKMINDTLGHSAGDVVLREVARRLDAALDDATTLARFGGDEFALVNGDAADPDALGERVLSAFVEPVKIGQRQFKVSVSIGIVQGRPGDTPDSMFSDADTAMYHAKTSGRARAEVFDESLRRRRQRRIEIENELRLALERDELRVVYQPVVELASLHTRGFEALLRWTHPRLGAVSPDEFIPVAEETGMILPIGEWVLERSLCQLADWHLALTAAGSASPTPWMAVNLSARQLEQTDLASRVAEALARCGVPADSLHLEITESVLMESIEHSLETIVALRELGVGISIDDFGTGYSSLSYLKQLPIDTLKIDRSFVSGLGTDPDDTSIVQAITNLAATLHLSVLAEGVENETQLSTLTDLGCTYGQGFLWSPGVDPDLASEWLAH